MDGSSGTTLRLPILLDKYFNQLSETILAPCFKLIPRSSVQSVQVKSLWILLWWVKLSNIVWSGTITSRASARASRTCWPRSPSWTAPWVVEWLEVRVSMLIGLSCQHVLLTLDRSVLSLQFLCQSLALVLRCWVISLHGSIQSSSWRISNMKSYWE